MEKCANCRYFQPDSSGEDYCTLQDCNVGWNGGCSDFEED